MQSSASLRDLPVYRLQPANQQRNVVEVSSVLVALEAQNSLTVDKSDRHERPFILALLVNLVRHEPSLEEQLSMWSQQPHAPQPPVFLPVHEFNSLDLLTFFEQVFVPPAFRHLGWMSFTTLEH